MRTGRLMALGILMIAAGCGDSHVNEPDASRDPSMPDGGSSHSSDDAGAGVDAAVAPDASTPPDGGTEPDAGPPEGCDTPGMIETVACGMCGHLERFCSSERVWSNGPCESEGVCLPGTTDSVSCGNCGTRSARCTDACVWDATGACEGEGECAPGTRITTGEGCATSEMRQLECNSACTFTEVSGCMAEGCPTPGTIETVACGMCGTQERFCNSAHAWEYGACGGEGVCMPGTTMNVECGMCGTRAARCTAECTWSPTGACTGEGMCSPGDMERTSAGCGVGETRVVTCDSSCAFTIAGACEAIAPVDVTFLLDMTGSHSTRVTSSASTLVSHCVAPLLALTDVYVGVSYYADFPDSGGVDVPFDGGIEPTTDASALSSAISSAPGYSGGDAPEATVEALSILSGGAVTSPSMPLACSSGRIAGGCWRPTAQRVIVVMTDAGAHNGPDPGGTGLLYPYSIAGRAEWPDVQSQLMGDGTVLVVMYNGATSANTDEYDTMLTLLGQTAADRVDDSTITVGCDAAVARIRAAIGR